MRRYRELIWERDTEHQDMKSLALHKNGSCKEVYETPCNTKLIKRGRSGNEVIG
jgi:hypothetical protein